MPEMPDVIGGELATDEWANAIRDRTVQRYADAATRTSEHGAPTPGDLSYLEDTGDVDVYHSGVWRHVGPQVASVQMLAGSAVPPGWLLCNGQAVSRTTYAALFAAISTTWGSGNGSTTFNVPDMRGRYPRGVAASGTGDALGDAVGSDSIVDHTHPGPSHTHTGPSHTHSFSDTTSGAQSGPFGGTGFAAGTIDHAHAVSGASGSGGTGSTGSSGTGATGAVSGTNPEQLPASRAINFIIKT